MKSKFLRIISLSLLLALGISAIPMPASAALGITSVLPSQVMNNVSTVITITGTDFVPESVVLLDGYGALSTSFQNASVLTATVPAGVPAGSYTVTVSTGIESVSCDNCLTVLAPTATPPPTATTVPLPFVRPQFVVRASRVADGNVRTNGEFRLHVVVENAGTASAYSTQAVFTSTDLVPLKTGGVAVLGVVAADDEVAVNQNFLVTSQIIGQKVVVIDLVLTYYDDQGASYSDKFSLSISASGAVTGGSGPAAPTATPTGVKSSQLVITGYDASIDLLQPGEQFVLTMNVQNVGNARAQRVTMIVGGGSSGTSGGGTPGPGGVSGGSGEFTNFAPVGASNVQSLGDLAAGGSVKASQNLIVNVSTNPGAYPMKITFSYLDDKNEVINDEQVITLLVYSLPKVDISFYRPVDPFFAGQPGALPIQVVNLGRRTAVLGNLKVSAANGMIENGTSLVGSLDAGGYFTLDSTFIPDQSGTVELTFTIDYTDDFNQIRSLTQTLEVEVMEGFDPSLDPSFNGGGEPFPVQPEESVWQKIWRFILGLFGLDSSAPSNGGTDGIQPNEEPMPMPAPGSGKG
jgi:hypothetical protein